MQKARSRRRFPGISRARGHVDNKTPLVIMAILAVIGYEEYQRRSGGASLLSLVNWWWVAGIAGGLVLLVALYAVLTYKRIRVEQVGDKTIVHFDGKQFEVLAEPPQVHRSMTGGAFGQPTRHYLKLTRGDEVLYSGDAGDGERLLAALTRRKPG